MVRKARGIPVFSFILVYYGPVSDETGLFLSLCCPSGQEMETEMNSDVKRMKERIGAIKKAHPT